MKSILITISMLYSMIVLVQCTADKNETDNRLGIDKKTVSEIQAETLSRFLERSPDYFTREYVRFKYLDRSSAYELAKELFEMQDFVVEVQEVEDLSGKWIEVSSVFENWTILEGVRKIRKSGIIDYQFFVAAGDELLGTPVLIQELPSKAYIEHSLNQKKSCLNFSGDAPFVARWNGKKIAYLEKYGHPFSFQMFAYYPELKEIMIKWIEGKSLTQEEKQRAEKLLTSVEQEKDSIYGEFVKVEFINQEGD